MSVTVLKLPLSQAEAELESRIDVGRQLLNEEILRPLSEPGQDPGLVTKAVLRGVGRAAAWRYGSTPQFTEIQQRVEKWHYDNCIWLDQNLGGEVAELQRAHNVKKAVNAFDFGPFLRESVEEEVSRLQSIRSRLHLWAPKANTNWTSPTGAGLTPNGPIFIVHGSDTLRAERVARIVNKATARDTIILREQPSLGQTLIEKFEQHATSASYAIVVLTPDDEGGRKGQGAHKPRGRQNVIFEMGYFYGILGRSQVSVLLHPDVERPSDMDGIVYIDFDDNGAWKIELFRELEHAQIHVDLSRAF